MAYISKFDPTTLLLGIYPTKMLTYVQKDVCERHSLQLAEKLEISYMLSTED